MKVETKFNLGDEVWAIYSNRLNLFCIKRIMVRVGGETIVKYSPQGGLTTNSNFREISYWYSESEVFATKEDLIKSL